MAQQKILFWIICFIILNNSAGYLFLCDNTKDPCLQANTTTMYQEYSRSENCIHNRTYNLCDRYLNVKWYKTEGKMLNRCPSLFSCGAEFPLWLNDSFPTVNDGVVNRTVCKRGFGDCCMKKYTIMIKNCQSFMAYCLIPSDGCDERYCFGENGTCEAPPQPTTTSTEVTTSDQTNPTTVHFRENKIYRNNTVLWIAVGISCTILLSVFLFLIKKSNGKVFEFSNLCQRKISVKDGNVVKLPDPSEKKISEKDGKVVKFPDLCEGKVSEKDEKVVEFTDLQKGKINEKEELKKEMWPEVNFVIPHTKVDSGGKTD